MTTEHRLPAADPRTAGPFGATKPAAAQLRRSRGQIFGLGVTQLVVCELALAACLAAIDKALLLIVAPMALASVALVLGRRNGRWLVDNWRMRRDFKVRAEPPRPEQIGDPRLAVLRELQPALGLTEATDRTGAQVGIFGDGRCWSALLAVEAAESGRGAVGGSTPLPLHVVADALRTRDVHMAAVQILTHTIPAPAAELSEDSPCVRSYRSLSPHVIPARRFTWVVLRLDPLRCPEAVVARGGGAVGAHRALLGTMSRLVTALDVAGVPARPVAADEALNVLTLTAGISPGRYSELPRRTREFWDSWAADDTVQACFWVRRWPRPAHAQDVGLLARLGDVRGAFTTVSLTMTGQEERGVHFRAVVRVAGTSREELAHIVTELHGAAADARLTRLDGEQLPAVLETLPLGGNAP